MDIEKAMDNYDTIAACKVTEKFFEILNNWYIRRNRDRFWKNSMDGNKIDAFNVLYLTLILMCQAIAPLLPFISEYIWKGLMRK